MVTEIRVTRMSEHRGLTDGDITIDQGTVEQATVPTQCREYPTEMGTIIIRRLDITRRRRTNNSIEKWRPSITLGGSIVGEEVIVTLDPKTGMGTENPNAKKRVEVYVSEAKKQKTAK